MTKDPDFNRAWPIQPEPDELQESRVWRVLRKLVGREARRRTVEAKFLTNALASSAAVASATKALTRELRLLRNGGATKSSLNALPRSGVDFAVRDAHIKIAQNARIAVHVGEGPATEYQLDMWLPALQATGIPMLVIARSPAMFDQLYRRNNVDLVYVQANTDAEALLKHCPSLRAILYPANVGSAIHFLRFTGLRHIFIGHGDSDKSSSCHNFFKVYDEIWTAGQAHLDRFKSAYGDFRAVDFHIVGRPGLNELMEETASPEPSKKFVYLPTWEGLYEEQNYSSMQHGAEFVRRVASITGREPVIKFHPLSGSVRREFKDIDAAYARAIFGDPRSPEVRPRSVRTASLMSQTDFLIADVSSVVTDYLVTQRPIFVYLPSDENLKIANSEMSYKDYAYVFSDEDELAALVRSVIVEGRDPLAAGRANALRYFVGPDEIRSNRFARELRRVAGLEPQRKADLAVVSER